MIKTLLNYMKTLTPDELNKFSVKCGTTVGSLKQIAYENRRASPALAVNIDRETNGKISFEVLRPDVDWGYVRNKKAA